MIHGLGFVFILIASVMDLKERKVSNQLILSFLISILLVQLVFGGLGDFSEGVLGMMAGLALYFPLWFIKVIGGADAKSLAVLGACVGPVQSLEIGLWSLVFGGLIGLGYLVYKKRLKGFLKNFYLSAVRLVTKTTTETEWQDLGKTKIPFIPMMGLGFLWVLGRYELNVF